MRWSETGDGYNVGEVRLWKVTDGGTPGTDGDGVGGTSPQSSLGSACDKVESGGGFDPKGIITGGNLVVHFDAAVVSWPDPEQLQHLRTAPRARFR